VTTLETAVFAVIGELIIGELIKSSVGRPKMRLVVCSNTIPGGFLRVAQRVAARSLQGRTGERASAPFLEQEFRASAPDITARERRLTWTNQSYLPHCAPFFW
jgi:hypothetical protein